MDKKEIQQEYMKLQNLDSQMQEIQENVQKLQEKVSQLEELKESVKKVENFEEGSKLQAPISPGIYLEGELKNKNQLLVNIGADVFVKKGIEGAQEVVDGRIDRVKDLIQDLNADLKDLSSEARKSQKKLQEHV